MATLTIVYNFFILPLIPKVGSVTTYFYYPLIGEIFLVGLAMALVGEARRGWPHDAYIHVSQI